jgi:1-deoxy-D-xylulose-5-phosphate reductoisomerase
MKRKKILILGSTGSIGINALKVVERFPDKFEVVALTAYNNIRVLARQIRQFRPKYAAVKFNGIDELKKTVFRSLKILDVERDIEQVVSLAEVDIVVIGMSGSAALKPFLKAVQCGKRVATANKEALVIAGEIIMREAKKFGAQVVPIDSEQSAILQCLQGQERKDLKVVHLTASGGPLLRVKKDRFDKLTVEEILAHPRWKMGKRITVDSATLMNKGFEVIEAMRLFGLQKHEINIVIHPEAIIHSMVEYKDGSIMAQLAETDMRLPIQYALSYPQRWGTNLKGLNFFELQKLTFEKPDLNRFPCLGLALWVAEQGGTLPSVLNASDEIAVDAFLNRKIPFTAIFETVKLVVGKHQLTNNPSIEEVLVADEWARVKTKEYIGKKYGI